VLTGFYGTLSVIGVWGPLTPSKVAELTGTPLTTVSDRLRRMVADGDVERVAHPGDGRSHLVQLTEAGDAHWKQGWPALQRTIAEVTANLERPVDEVEGSLEDLIEALRKSATAPTPIS
jgi:DNA-binding MarR family transcriptional regulator